MLRRCHVCTNPSTKETVLVYPDTGEIVNTDETILFAFSKVGYKKQELPEQEPDTSKLSEENQSTFGDWSWVAHNEGDPFFSELSSLDLQRVMYLTSFMSYKGYLVKDNGHKIKEDDISRLLGVTKETSDDFIMKIKDIGILEQDSDGLIMNKTRFSKGEIPSLPQYTNKDRSCFKIFSKAIQDLHSQTKEGGRKRLGYLYRLIPYIHKDYNILCQSIDQTFESHLKNIEPMTWDKFFEVICYSSHDRKRLFNDLFSVEFTGKDEGASNSVIRIVNGEDIGLCSKPVIWINPRLYYGGNIINNIASLWRETRGI